MRFAQLSGGQWQRKPAKHILESLRASLFYPKQTENLETKSQELEKGDREPRFIQEPTSLPIAVQWGCTRWVLQGNPL